MTTPTNPRWKISPWPGRATPPTCWALPYLLIPTNVGALSCTQTVSAPSTSHHWTPSWIVCSPIPSTVIYSSMLFDLSACLGPPSNPTRSSRYWNAHLSCRNFALLSDSHTGRSPWLIPSHRTSYGICRSSKHLTTPYHSCSGPRVSGSYPAVPRAMAEAYRPM